MLKYRRNIFSPNKQVPLVKAIAAHYGLSSRHTSALTADPLTPESEDEHKTANPQKRSLHMPWHKDIESEGYSETPREGVNLRRRGGGGYMDLVSNVWHWHAVEWGGRCKLNTISLVYVARRVLSLFFSPISRRNIPRYNVFLLGYNTNPP